MVVYEGVPFLFNFGSYIFSKPFIYFSTRNNSACFQAIVGLPLTCQAGSVLLYMSKMTWSRRGHLCRKTWPIRIFPLWSVYYSSRHNHLNLNSCPPELELGALTKWLASRMLVWVSRKASLHDPVFLIVYGAQESIPRNEFRQPM